MNAAIPNINLAWTHLLVEELRRCGVRFFGIAPGSRSSPLAAAVAAQKGVEPVVHFDERGLGFMALGHARATGKPSVVITTSGTAAANLLPAVVEAFMDGIPLIVLTADRPPELRDTSANQTIDQVHLFGHYVKWFFDLPCPSVAISPQMVLTTVDQAVHRSVEKLAGPVHINCMFREPLASVSDGLDAKKYLKSVDRWLKSGKPYTTYSFPTICADDFTIQRVEEILRRAKKGLVVVGALKNGEQVAVLSLIRKLKWPAVTDILSGLRCGGKAKEIIAHGDLLLVSERFCRDHRPDVILHLGGRIVSKRLADFLACAEAQEHIVVNADPRRLDPVHNVTLKVESDIADFCRRMNVGMKKSWLTSWAFASEAVERILEARKKTLDEPAVATTVSEQIPAEHVLFLGNSMPIRDMNVFGAANGPCVSVAANRGASGIDGTLATAVGFARGHQRGATALIGDLALLHDLNSLALATAVNNSFVIIVINNNGGGIFSFLPVAQSEKHFEKYFGTPHGYTFEHAAKQFGLHYERPKSIPLFQDAYAQACKAKHATLIEVITDRNENVKCHRAIQEAVISSLDNF